MKMNFKWISIALMFLVSAMLLGCDNTIKGFGQDMQDNGKKVESSAKDNQ